MIFFIHITKNAGTSIENTLLTSGIKVGRYQKEFWKGPEYDCTNTTYWHLPLKLWPQKCVERLEGYTTFAVIRDPVDRAISEYNCVWGNQIARSADRRIINYVLIKYLLEVAGLLSPSMATGHWIPQHRYVYLKGKRVPEHLLLFSELKQDWKDFAVIHGLPHTINRDNVGEKIATRSDLYWYTRALIRLVYAKDYALINRVRKERKSWKG